MSAGSPRNTRSPTRTCLGGNIVSPQQVTDPTILDSVAGFINEVATYNIPADAKDLVQWARFEQIEFDVHFESYNREKTTLPALLLVLGYTSGIQVSSLICTRNTLLI